MHVCVCVALLRPSLDSHSQLIHNFTECVAIWVVGRWEGRTRSRAPGGQPTALSSRSKLKSDRQPKLQLQPKGVVIYRGPLQAIEQLLLPVEAALVQLPIPRRVLDRPQLAPSTSTSNVGTCATASNTGPAF